MVIDPFVKSKGWQCLGQIVLLEVPRNEMRKHVRERVFRKVEELKPDYLVYRDHDRIGFKDGGEIGWYVTELGDSTQKHVRHDSPRLGEYSSQETPFVWRIKAATMNKQKSPGKSALRHSPGACTASPPAGRHNACKLPCRKRGVISSSRPSSAAERPAAAGRGSERRWCRYRDARFLPGRRRRSGRRQDWRAMA